MEVAWQLTSHILIVNPGSSSLKLRVLDANDSVVAARDLERDGDVVNTLAALEPVDAVGVRFVHGGSEYTVPTLINDGVLDDLRVLTALAPLHQPTSVAAAQAIRGALPMIPVVACFDTAFHARMPATAFTYALPKRWRDQWGLRRFGFHGLSHAYAARRTSELLGRAVADLRIVSCHLGAGASLAAVQGGKSVDTTMGFTPLEGLVMAKRSGSVDPGLLMWLQQVGLSADELNNGLEHESGLLGLAGTADMREVVAASDRGDSDARLALNVYVHRLRAFIASMVAAMDGIDALVFTGGVGENSEPVRAMAVQGMSHLGMMLDDKANSSISGDAILSDARSSVAVLMVRSREDIEIARGVRSVVRSVDAD